MLWFDKDNHKLLSEFSVMHLMQPVRCFYLSF